MNLIERIKRSSFVEKNRHLYRRRIDPTPLEYVRYAIMLIALGYLWYERYKVFDYLSVYLYGPLAVAHYYLHKGLHLAVGILPHGFIDMAIPSFIAWAIYAATRRPWKGFAILIFGVVLHFIYTTPPVSNGLIF